MKTQSRSLRKGFAPLFTLMFVLNILFYFQVMAGEPKTRGLARSYSKGISKIVKNLEKQMEKDKKYIITVAGFHPTTGPKLIFSDIIEAELVKEFSSSKQFQVAFYKDNPEALKIIQLSQTAYFDKAIELGKFVKADFLVTGEYSIKSKKIHLIVTIQNLEKNLKIAGDDIEIRTSSLPKNALDPIPTTPRPLDDSLGELIEDIHLETAEKPKVLVGNFTYGDSRVPSSFGSYLKDKMQLLMVQSGQYMVLSGQSAQNMNASQKFDNQQSMRGLENQVNLFVSGRYWDVSEKVGVALMMQDNYDQILYSREVEVDKRSIPNSINIKPDDLQNIKTHMQAFEELEPQKTSPEFSIQVWPDKGDGAVYKEGEQVRFYFKTNRDCYLLLIHTDQNKTVQFLFPNTYARNNRIEKDKTYIIPDESYGFDITVTEPYGFEMIKALASTDQFDEIKRIEWDAIDEVFVQSSVRGLAVTKKEPIEATDTCTLITEAR
ncbi:DUF4384 domain-containing protein [candidate division CSSED10-310 bacterium]|uniref:DUF4384 domain-containing protein n=1 Tax=candidate division CSSED10-310 bacterium TaxID=2855610 RepID=A0ABV6Z572_UNCC1